MSKVLAGFFREVVCSDIRDCNYGEVTDYLRAPLKTGSFDYVITNPPFCLAEEFVARSLAVARVAVAILARTSFLEGTGRFLRLYRSKPPAKILQFAERVPMVKGRLDRNASTATSYAWLIWRIEPGITQAVFDWIPPCRKQLERPGDYDCEHVGTTTRDPFGSARHLAFV